MSSFTILAAPSTCHARACSDICCKRGGLINNAATTSSRLCVSLAQRAQPRSSNNSAFASSWPGIALKNTIGNPIVTASIQVKAPGFVTNIVAELINSEILDVYPYTVVFVFIRTLRLTNDS